MMGRHDRDQEHLFYSFCLDEAVPDDHLVRAIAAVLDLSWVHAELASYYSKIGRPSIDPVLMIRMLIVGYVFAIRSERALCREKVRKVLEARCRAATTAQRDVRRARIVLLAAAGRSTRSIAEEVGVQPRIVSNWRRRFADHGLDGLKDRPRAGKKPTTARPRTGAFWRFWINRRLRSMPGGRVRCWPRLWATLMFSMSGASCASTISTSPPASRGARATIPRSAKAADVVGLYVDPPAKAIVLCVDEKPSIQALERAQGYLKLPSGRALTGQSHDYKRHGTTTLLAALEVATGRIIAAHSKRRRGVEFLGFMNCAIAAFPDRELHVILDNLNTRKKNKRWLKRHPNVHFHFTPTRSSWLNQVETWFSILQGQSLNGASFTAVEQLQEHIDAFIAAYNETAEPFAWTKKKVYRRRFKNRRITQL